VVSLEALDLARLKAACAARMPARVRSSTKACADSVTTAAQLSGKPAAVATAIAPPTLWPNGTIASKLN